MNFILGYFSSRSDVQPRLGIYYLLLLKNVNLFCNPVVSFPGAWVWADEMPPHIVHHPSDVVVKVGNPATLSCRVDGKPKPTIEWLHNGQPLETGKEDRHLQPIVLSEGSLFFLNVGRGKHGPSHEGFYVCIARNSAGIAISRNASLYIAGEMESYSCT